MEKRFYEIGYFQVNGLNWKSFETLEMNLFVKFYEDLGYSIII